MNHFILEKCVTRPSILIDYDEFRIKSQPKEEISRSAVYAIYIIAINGILAFCSYVIIDSQTPIFG